MRLSPTLDSEPRAPSQGVERHGSAATQTGGRAPHPDLAGWGSGGSAWSGRGFVSLRIDR